MMTRFIDTTDLSRLLQKIGIEPFLRLLTQQLTENFKRWNDFEKSARLASHSEIGVIELMPVSNTQLYGFKYVNGHPANTAKGLSTVMAFGALAEVETGLPLLLSELTLATALRTAATSVMAAQALARCDASCMAMIGCGAQGEFQALAFHHLLGIKRLHIYDVDGQAMDKLRANLAHLQTLEIIPFDATAKAVRGVDIISTITADKALATIITPDMVEPGMHINGIGGDCPGKTEIAAEVLRRSKIFVEYEEQTRIEGDIQQLPGDHPVTELWQILRGDKTGRDDERQITLFDSVGFALEDFSILQLLYQLSLQHGIGQDIELTPQLENPKDLFALVQPKPCAHQAA